MNKYENWYNSIIKTAQHRQIDGYMEKHHIIPQSLGGNNEPRNLVKLTAREHFICHWLLVKFQTGKNKAKMVYALNGMKRNGDCTQRYETKITGRVYENLKKQFSIVHSAIMTGRTPWNKGIPITEEQREKNRKAAPGKKRSLESIAKSVAKQTGQKRTQETKNRIRDAIKGILKGPMSEEEKLKRSIALKGKPKKKEMGVRLSQTIAAQLAAGTHYSQQPKQECPHCLNKFSKGTYTRYHGANCRQKADK